MGAGTEAGQEEKVVDSLIGRSEAQPAPIMATFSTGATRSADNGNKLAYKGYISPRVLRRFAQYMHKHRVQADGQVREADNWKKGMSRARYKDSLLRHQIELWLAWDGAEIHPEGPRDPQDEEELLCAILFNGQGLLHEMLLGRDVQ